MTSLVYTMARGPQWVLECRLLHRDLFRALRPSSLVFPGGRDSWSTARLTLSLVLSRVSLSLVPVFKENKKEGETDFHCTFIARNSFALLIFLRACIRPGLSEAEMRTEAGDVKEPGVEAGPPSEHGQGERQQEEAEQRLHN